MLDDYVMYLVESLHQQERANDLMCILRGQELTGNIVVCLCVFEGGGVILGGMLNSSIFYIMYKRVF